MKPFYVEAIELRRVLYCVEAESAEDAKRRVAQCENETTMEEIDNGFLHEVGANEMLRVVSGPHHRGPFEHASKRVEVEFLLRQEHTPREETNRPRRGMPGLDPVR